jgi:RHS repeat-associated protein
VEVTNYIDGVFECHQRGGASSGANNHIHIMDDKQRVALVRVGSTETGDIAPAIQFQLADHLGSSNVVVDATGAPVNREEFLPHGETSFGSFAKKRFRSTGVERDEESGLNYHGARYYPAWLGRWASCDPIGFSGGVNLYCYCSGNCIGLTDPTGTEPQADTLTCTVLPTSRHDPSNVDDPLADQNIDLQAISGESVNSGGEGLTSFERAIESARMGADSGFPVDPIGKRIDLYFGEAQATVGQALTGDKLRSAQAIRCSDQNGASYYAWATEDRHASVYWSREGKLLDAVWNGTGFSTTPGLGASLLNPVDLMSGWIAAKMVGKTASVVADAIEGELNTTLRGVNNYWIADAEGVIGHLSSNRWYSRWLPGGTRVIMSRGEINQLGLGRALGFFTGESGRPVTILSGTHGTVAGQMASEALENGVWVTGGEFLRADMALFGRMRGVTVMDVSSMSEMELQTALRSGGDIYAAWCHSGLSFFLGRGIRASGR